jgi:hypothetical protein
MILSVVLPGGLIGHDNQANAAPVAVQSKQLRDLACKRQQQKEEKKEEKKEVMKIREKVKERRGGRQL